MTRQPSSIPTAQSRFAERLFDAAANLEAVAKAAPTAWPLGFAVLFRYATDPEFEPGNEFARALARDQRARKDVEALLRRFARVTFPRAAAAADAEKIEERFVAGWRIRIRRVQANPAQVWIIMDYDEKSIDPPNMLFVGETRQVLPHPQDGRYQFRLDADSDVVKGLQDTDTEVFLL